MPLAGVEFGALAQRSDKRAAPIDGRSRGSGRQMRTYAAAVVVLLGLYSAPAAAADLPTKKQAPEEIVAPALPSTWHYEITGYGWGTDLAGQTGVGPFPTSPFFIRFPVGPLTCLPTPPGMGRRKPRSARTDHSRG